MQVGFVEMDPRGENTHLGKEQQSEWAQSRRGSWSDILGFPQNQRTTSFVMYVLSRFTSIEHHHRVVVMLSAIIPSDSLMAVQQVSGENSSTSEL